MAMLHLVPPMSPPAVDLVSVADLPTEFGHFQLAGFVNDVDGKQHVALIRGDVAGQEDVLVRMHSECLTGDVLGSARCDCRAQLHAALETLGRSERGVLLYLRQEGRGIGLLNKIRAYALQDDGLDTVEANRALGFDDDERRYDVAAGMLRALDVRSVSLMTNNPDKVAQLRRNGVPVRRIGHQMPATDHNRFYLQTKAARSGHLLSFPDLLPAS